MNKAIVIGYCNMSVAVVESVQQGIDKVKEWNSDSSFVEQGTEGFLVGQTTPDNRHIQWFYTEVDNYIT